MLIGLRLCVNVINRQQAKVLGKACETSAILCRPIDPIPIADRL